MNKRKEEEEKEKVKNEEASPLYIHFIRQPKP
jgi:hypothetical protein